MYNLAYTKLAKLRIFTRATITTTVKATVRSNSVKRSLSYSLIHQLPVNENLVKTSPALPEISRYKTDRHTDFFKLLFVFEIPYILSYVCSGMKNVNFKLQTETFVLLIGIDYKLLSST